MAALPYMRLYIADYLADTAHLSAAQHGAYLLLIMNYWQTGRALPADDSKLARIARMTPKEWAEHGPMLAEFFHDIDGAWHHKRIDHELDAVRAKSDSARNARAQRKSYERRTPAPTNVERTPNHTDTDTDTDTETDTEKKDTPSDAIADEFDGQFWPAYPLRKAKGAALKAYRSARKRTTLTVILTALDKQRSVFAEPKYSPHAATWLNGDRWLDEIIEGAGNGPKPTKFDNMLAGVLAAAGGGDAGETVEPLPAGSQITGSLENADGRFLGSPEPLSGRRH